jgi:DNA repair and recombination RAD54-like protein
LLAREPNASGVVRLRATELQSELSAIVNEFILKRGNILNARHLPPKLVQYVCCQPSDLQAKLYDILLDSKEVRHIR